MGRITPSSKERIQAPLRIFRPTVREILASLSKEEKILIEEGFQRLVLQIDRCFTGMRFLLLFFFFLETKEDLIEWVFFLNKK